jgi:dTDP-4-amino-4,6-dideoxygalactose transaminase
MKFNDLSSQWEQIREKSLAEIDALGKRGDYIGGKAIQEFEKNFAEFCGSKFACGISNGTDALKIAFQIFDLGPMDLVIMPANTFIADYLALKNLPGFLPRVALVDHDHHFTLNMSDLDQFLEKERGNYEKVLVVAVHLYGHPCDLASLKHLKEKYNLLVLEDCSQSHGTECKEIKHASLGEISVWSLYPGKNLGALGDAGILTTDLEEVDSRARMLRNYGSPKKYHYDELGHNHRLDTIQAIVLDEKLKFLKEWNLAKVRVAQRYLDEINNLAISLPKIAPWCEFHSYHIFCVGVMGNRESLMSHLEAKGVPSLIHYPIPIHKTKIFQKSDLVVSSSMTDMLMDRIASLPIHPFMSEEEIDSVIEAVNSWDYNS